YSPKDLGTVAANLRKVDPEAFPVLFQAHLLKQQEAIFKQIGGRDSPQAFGRFVDEVSGVAGSPQRKMFDEAMKNVALAKGQDPAEVVRGANDYMNALRVMSREQGSLGAVAQNTIEEAGSTIATRLMKAASFTAPLRGAGWAIERITRRRLFEKLSDALVSDNGIKLLREVANYDSPAEKLKAISRGLASVGVQAQE
ncbi:MAG: hypothetical protein ACRD2L_20580, partial [Terriglobia bacterium]